MFRPAYQRLCRHCKAVDIALVYEHVGNNRWKWVARNYNTGTIHICPELTNTNNTNYTNSITEDNTNKNTNSIIDNREITRK